MNNMVSPLTDEGRESIREMIGAVEQVHKASLRLQKEANSLGMRDRALQRLLSWLLSVSALSWFSKML